MNTSILSEGYEEWKSLLLIHKFAVDEINTKLKILNEEFQLIHSYNPIEHIKARVKTPKSIVEKLTRRGYEVSLENAKEYIDDIAGLRVICSFTSDIYTLYDLLEQQSDIEVIKVKDYIGNPKPNGYQSLHMIVKIPVFLTNKVENVTVEIQIRTIAMDFWASLEHKIYYKFNKTVPCSLTGQLKECADIVTDLDKKMLQIKRDIEENYNV